MEKKYRVWGAFGKYQIHSDNPPRVWIGTLISGIISDPTAILEIRDSHGNTDQVMVGEPFLQINK